MHGQEDEEQGHERALYDRLGHGEGIGRPRRRRAREMVRAMEEREQAGVMHRPVGPVEPGVVRHQHEGERQHEIERPRLPEAAIDREPALHRGHEDAGGQEREDQRRTQRGQDLAADVARRGPAGLQLARRQPGPPEHGHDRRHQRRRHQITRGIGDPQRRQGGGEGFEQVAQGGSEGGWQGMLRPPPCPRGGRRAKANPLWRSGRSRQSETRPATGNALRRTGRDHAQPRAVQDVFGGISSRSGNAPGCDHKGLRGRRALLVGLGWGSAAT